MENENVGIVQEFAEANSNLLKDMKAVLISVSVGAVGYFLIELGRGIVTAVTKNGIKVPEFPTK